MFILFSSSSKKLSLLDLSMTHHQEACRGVFCSLLHVSAELIYIFSIFFSLILHFFNSKVKNKHLNEFGKDMHLKVNFFAQRNGTHEDVEFSVCKGLENFHATKRIRNVGSASLGVLGQL